VATQLLTLLPTSPKIHEFHRSGRGAACGVASEGLVSVEWIEQLMTGAYALDVSPKLSLLDQS